MQASAISHIAICTRDMEKSLAFYRDILDMEPFSKLAGRQLFYRCGNQVLLIFDPESTKHPPKPGALPVPPHGAVGEGHVCFRASAPDMEAWRKWLEQSGVEIESDFVWPSGGRSIYFRDPAGNCLEFAEPKIWGLA